MGFGGRAAAYMGGPLSALTYEAMKADMPDQGPYTPYDVKAANADRRLIDMQRKIMDRFGFQKTIFTDPILNAERARMNQEVPTGKAKDGIPGTK